MKIKSIYILLFSFLFLAIGCEKDDNNVIITTASINVVNAAIDAGPVKINPGATSNFSWAKATTQIGYSSNAYAMALSGNRTITVVNAADTTKTWVSKQVEVKGVNTLYLTGQAPSVEGIFVAESSFPYVTAFGGDNSSYIRFINLSSNSPALNINIKDASTNEVTVLLYKGISVFKKYATAPAIPGYGTTPAVPATPNYLFEIRDASTNMLLFTYTLNASATANRFKTMTLVIKGMVGTTSGTNAFGVFQVNDAG